MSRKVLTNLDLSKNELQNAVVQPLAVAPSNPALGQIYTNSADKEAGRRRVPAGGQHWRGHRRS